ncbi:AbrB/MazE/SpoVT family DNA-binding domain-containing protein [Pyrofollis japonicus]|uniref:AbrB/MazE/SpoVT family DNA-binding domain-containing protein n=1 Tax=Pyrofollis japonicus TaxID=3060460 RepID=UPI00295C31CE|nr:AbrB/MazE/SpoVT family DNA-binding domain-containing protein [Pyrofollis japonicus]BEP17344.1 AbrB/MazE/SpoVT family DNA-binding domain-containing protein [Pyrofollis japonicus]
MALTVRVGKKGIIVLPKAVREALNIVEGSLLQVEVRDGEVVLRPLDLWERVWGCCKGSAEEAEKELDEEESEWLKKRSLGK